MIGVNKPRLDEAVVFSEDANHPRNKSEGSWVLVATILGSSMAFIDGTVINVALPALQKNLNATVVDVQWVVESYALFLSSLLLVGGSLGDRYGRRLVYAIGIALFALASAWCALAPNITQLVVARAFQGVGAALLVPGSLAIISASFDAQRRGPAIGTWSAFTSITAAIGPVIGGWLIENISWRAAFYINIPIAAIVLLVIFLRVPESRDTEQNSRLDWWGAILVTAGFAGLVYGLIESSHAGWKNPFVLLTVIGGAVLLIVFLFLESRVSNPMLPLSLFRLRQFRGANLLTFFLYAGLSGTFLFLPLNLIQMQHYSATAAGAALLPFIFIMFSLSRWSGGLIERYGSRLPLVVGPVIAAAGFALLAVPDIGKSYWTSFFPALTILGLGMAVSVAPLTTTVMNSVEQNRSGIASGVNNAVSRTAGLLAVAIFGIVMLRAFDHRLDDHLQQIPISEHAQKTLDKEKVKLGAMQLPRNISRETRIKLEDAVQNSFIFAFRNIMFLAVALALFSSITAWIMIQGKTIAQRE